ncbi:MAG: hypothetical protein OEZ20_02205 [candidate division WOR-3 bacterium]|nr:hypothetical protein [candidate division WOR-3 bacterium]
MFIFAGLVSAIIFVTLGYFAFWTAMRTGTAIEIAKFGKIMGIILFVIAGLALIFSFMGGPFMGHMMGGGMFSYPFRGWGMGRMSNATIEDIYQEIEELDDEIDDLEQRVNEMPVFVQDLVKQNIERMKK